MGLIATAVADGVQSTNSAASDDDHETYIRAAREARRAVIAAMPGSGDARGVWFYQGVVYGVRDNAGGTAGVMYKSSSAGLVEVDLGNQVDFDTGAVASFVEGETITFSPSGATAVVVALGITSGAFGGSDEAGQVYLKTVTGTITAADTMAGGTSSATANCNSVLTAVTLPPAGKYEFRNYNFGGMIDTFYMWGVNGVGRGFRYDGTDFAFVHVTGLTDAQDKPQHLHPHLKQLFYSMNEQVQHSAPGLPMIWDAIVGASGLATGDIVTGMEDQPGGVLAILNRNRTYILYGKTVLDWDLKNFSLERGAIEWTIQDMGYSVYYDDRGLASLRQTDEFGDFKQSSISETIDPLIQAQKSLVVDSVRVKSKSQYRVYFSDKTGIVARFARPNHPEYMPFALDHEVTCICAEEDTDGIERIFFGSTDGFIYEADSGESFDGELLEHYIRLAFCHCKTSRQKKRFHKATIQLDAPDLPASLKYTAEFSYGSTEVPAGSTVSPEIDRTGGGFWSEVNWGDFVWGAQIIGEAIAYIDGEGINISLQIRGTSNYERAHTLQSIVYNYSPRGLRR